MITTKTIVLTIVLTLFVIFLFASASIYIDTQKSLRRMEESMKAERRRQKQKEISDLAKEIEMDRRGRR